MRAHSITAEVCLLSLFWLGLSVASVAAKEPSREAVQFFELKVRPLLAENCQQCHGPEKQKANLRLDSRSAMLAGGDSGPVIVAGSPRESLMIRAVRYEDSELEMPPKRKLGDTKIDVLTRWVTMGAPWPAGGKGASSPEKSKTHTNSDEERDFWSFQPVVRRQAPRVRKRVGVRNSIDAFVMEKLEVQGLAPSAPANKRDLIRRVTFDLVGLPPSPEEIGAFLADDAPDAFGRLVDRLLGSPRYGERWGRHWLDLVRYAQTNGYERDDEKPYAWRYRDYVIRAFNQDKPYDRFVIEQLAGDEVDDLTHDSIIATGFYRLGVWDDEPDDKLLAGYEELDDIVRTTSTTFLGLTIGCARCHEHKFNPIPQADYYRFLAFFRNVSLYGKNKSSTHWEANPEAIYTPLFTPAEFARWQGERRELRSALADAKAKLDAKTVKKATPGTQDVDGALDEKKAERRQELSRRIEKLEKSLDEKPFDLALSVREPGQTATTTQVLIRGNPLTPGEEVEPGFPSVLSAGPPRPGVEGSKGTSSDLRNSLAEYGIRPTSRRRIVLARWIADPENPLTARVIVNRIWHYHFGRGLVSTPSDFGKTGVRPSHPELLDWLASEFVAGGWSFKRLHRLVLCSSTYRQSSEARSKKAMAVDPDNRLLWRQNLRRLEAEAIRDAILAVNGQLNFRVGGRGIFPKLSRGVLSTQSRPGRGWGESAEDDLARRSVYIFTKRTLGVPFMETFDLPTPDKPQPSRPTTTIAPQALILLNSAFMEKAATNFAGRLQRELRGEKKRTVRRAVELALGRLPTGEEVETLIGFLQRQESAWKALGARSAEQTYRQALAELCRLILNLNEFVYID